MAAITQTNTAGYAVFVPLLGRQVQPGEQVTADELIVGFERSVTPIAPIPAATKTEPAAPAPEPAKTTSATPAVATPKE